MYGGSGGPWSIQSPRQVLHGTHRRACAIRCTASGTSRALIDHWSIHLDQAATTYFGVPVVGREEEQALGRLAGFASTTSLAAE